MSSEINNSFRVVMLVPSLPPLPAGGAEMQALKLGEELVSKGVNVSYITPGKNNIKGETIIQGMKVFRLNSWPKMIFDAVSAIRKKTTPRVPRIAYDDKHEITDRISSKVGWPTFFYYNIFYIHSLLFLFRRRKQFDIIHAHTMEWSAIIAARLGKRLKKPVIIKDSTMNGFQSLERFPSGEHLQQMIAANAHFVAMTDIIRKNLLNAGIPASRIYKIPNGISINSENPPTRINEDPPKVLFVGNLYQQPAKGIDILFRAWTIVHESFPTAILQIIGDGASIEYRDFVKNLGIENFVQFLGKQNDLSGFHKQAWVFVLPSRREGMSNALMEAMLNAIPCVVTDISGSRDLVENELNGMVVPPVDVEKLATAIVYLLSNKEKAEALGRRARETIINQFDIKKVADQYISLYQRLLKRESPLTRD